MADETKIYTKQESLEHSNASSHYIIIVAAVAIGFLGVILRFFGDNSMLDLASNILLIIGIIIGFKAVFTILK
ncbi:hypothetical protein GS399_18810 [Pedobacter sp. HMF7647]|uniref:Uncharacterized protein n=1 Tax=Hufsiella arboris TaxID=2695275 RepID=A0A7K1YEJ9_9SPHI|nr:hypothetical protein [Hufsiella arboris]MXV53026.1 hypothetical protein [Hufsiella arboris]